MRQRIKKKTRKTPEQLFQSLVDDWDEFHLWAKSVWDESDDEFRDDYHARFSACLKDLEELLPDVNPQKIDPDKFRSVRRRHAMVLSAILAVQRHRAVSLKDRSKKLDWCERRRQDVSAIVVLP